MALELCFELLDKRQVRSGIAQEDGRHPTEASYLGDRVGTISQRSLPLKAAG
jgi:hypothetical protein